MSAAIDIIHGSLFRLGVHSEIKPVSSEMLNYSFRKFKSFIKSLKDSGVDRSGLIVPLALPDDCSERGGVTSDIEAMFALEMAPYFRITPTQELIVNAAKSKENISRFYRTLEVPSLVNCKNIFKGQGNR